VDISVIGSGHVGLVTGAALAQRGHRVLCVDRDANLIQGLREGRLPFYEPGLDALVESVCRSKRLSFATSTAEGVDFGKVLFICVPTPATPEGGADLGFVEEVARDIARSLKEYRLVVEKSTESTTCCGGTNRCTSSTRSAYVSAVPSRQVSATSFA
jgi:UDPglucose 6-dehydrogenase